LVVDDEAAIVKVIGRIVRAEHEFLGLTSAVEALDRIRQGERFDLIFCDLMMPVMTGMELHTQLLQYAPDQAEKIVFLTGGAFTPRARAFLDEIGNQHIEKPFDPRVLKALVNGRVR
jgi:CheY-like chemotaxis protein